MSRLEDHLRDSPTDEPPLGCGKLPREWLELAAIARSDRSLEVDERTSTHLVLCKECVDAVERLHREHALLTELAQAARPEPSRSRGGASAPAAGNAPGGTPASAADSEIPGYQFKRELHRGGQGAVFLAEQLATRRMCAVKMLLGGRFATPMQRARFEREVEVIAALRHPDIVTLYESGLSRDGEPWFAMEFVEGERLDEFVKRVKPPVRTLVEIMRRVAEAIAYAHRRGVIHRDLKPGNILIDQDGAPRILDFGLARSAAVAEATDPRSGSTLAGEFIGTFAYAAPEQLSGDPSAVDSRCDLYALGVLFYEILAGRRPFEGAKSIAELVAQKSTGVARRPSALAADPRIDGDLDVIVLRLLAADPARRYATASALAEDLSRYLDGRPILAREDSLAYVVSKTVRRHWIASTAALAFALTVIGAATALFILYSNAEIERTRAEEQRARAEREQARAETQQRRVQRAYLTFESALASADPEEGQGSSTMNVRDFLAMVEKEVRLELEDEPLVLAEMLKTLGNIQLGFDAPERSREAVRSAHALFAEAHSTGAMEDERMAEAEELLARQLFNDGDLDGSERSYRRAIELSRASRGTNAVATVDLERRLATVLRTKGLVQEARAVLDGALEHAAGFPPDAEAILVKVSILNGQAVLASELGDRQGAITAFRQTLDELSKVVEPNDYRRGRTLSSLADAELAVGSLVDAERHATEAVKILRERKGSEARWTKEAIEILARIKSARAN